MKAKQNLQDRILGWFPQEPKMGVINSADVQMQPTLRATRPFLASGALMITAAALSAYLGFNLLQNYAGTVNKYNVIPDYAGLYVGLLNVVSFGLDLFAAMLLLLRKHAAVAETLVAVVLACGLASPWFFVYFHSPLVYMYWQTFALQGLVTSAPMITFSLVTLVLVRVNRKKLNLDFNHRWTRFPFKAAGVLMVIASLPFAYNVAYWVWLLWIAKSALSSYVVAYLEMLFHLALFGLDLFVASLFLRRRRIRVVAVVVAVMLSVGLPLQMFLLKGFEDPFYVFDFPTVACLIAALMLTGLNYSRLTQTINTEIPKHNEAT